VGEGGNLGLTQRGRIEAARSGVLLNTDAIDNSAGVDTSDHEVNIKILLDEVVRTGDLTEKQRDQMLVAMTDEVAGLVLRDNYEQNILLGNARAQAPQMLSVHHRFIRELEQRGRLDRAVEFLPDDSGIAELVASGAGLSSPELAVLVAYSKMVLIDDLESSSVPDEPWFQRFLVDYFPEQIRQTYADRLPHHKLRREIVTTGLANDIVNRGGITFVYRAQEESSADPAAVARAYAVAREVFGLEDVWAAVEALDNQVPTAAQSALLLEARRLLDRGTRWFLQNRSGTIDVAAEIARFKDGVTQLTSLTPEMLVGTERERLDRRTDELVELGAPRDLALRVSALLDVFGLLDVIQIAQAHEADLIETAQVYFTLSERYEIDRLLLRVTALPRADRWSALARFALRYDLYTALAGMTDRVLATTSPAPAVQRVEEWESQSAEALARTRSILEEVAANDSTDIAPVSVALRVLRNLVRST
jgi:glutamate dehydrogenase